MTICFFGIYNPNYSRNKVLIKGLRENGIEVVECSISPEKYSCLKLGKYFSKFFLFFELAKKLLVPKERYDILFVAFPGYQIVWLAKLLGRKKIIYDAFISFYDTYIFDRKLYSPKSFRAKYYWFLDWLSCKLADKILLDTNEHIQYFTETFRIKEEKFKRIFVGSDDSIFFPRNFKKNNDNFLVHFHGKYIPLQGIEYIIKAAKLLEREYVQFNLIGRGQIFAEIMELSKKLKIKNINFIDNTSLIELAEYMARADICLGIFGKSAKTNRVIPNKAYEAIAMKKPLITADTPAIRELFENKKHALLCARADSRDLANKILELKNNPELRVKIANNGHYLFKKKLTPKILGEEFKKILLNL